MTLESPKGAVVLSLSQYSLLYRTPHSLLKFHALTIFFCRVSDDLIPEIKESRIISSWYWLAVTLLKSQSFAKLTREHIKSDIDWSGVLFGKADARIYFFSVSLLRLNDLIALLISNAEHVTLITNSLFLWCNVCLLKRWALYLISILTAFMDANCAEIVL